MRTKLNNLYNQFILPNIDPILTWCFYMVNRNALRTPKRYASTFAVDTYKCCTPGSNPISPLHFARAHVIGINHLIKQT